MPPSVPFRDSLPSTLETRHDVFLVLLLFFSVVFFVSFLDPSSLFAGMEVV